MIYQPLTWPFCWHSHGFLEDIVADVPVFGINSRVRRKLNEQLQLRGSDYLDMWADSKASIPVAKRMSEIITEYLRWRNDRFIPKDPCEILLWSPDRHMRIESVLLRLGSEFAISNDALANIGSLSFEQFASLVGA